MFVLTDLTDSSCYHAHTPMEIGEHLLVLRGDVNLFLHVTAICNHMFDGDVYLSKNNSIVINKFEKAVAENE